MKGGKEYSQPVQRLEAILAQEAGARTIEHANGVWIRTLDQRRGARSVALFFVPSGEIFPRHSHSQTEFITVTDGLGIYMNRDTGVTRHMPMATCVKVPPDTAHQFEGIQDTYGVVVMVPSTEAFGE